MQTSAMPIGNRQPNTGSTKLSFSLSDIQAATSACLPQSFLSPSTGGFGPSKIELLDALGGVGEDKHPIVRHFEKAAKDG